jgi:ABC-2 type transport system ATP-binding protein
MAKNDTTEMPLTISNICKKYGSKDVLRDVSLEVNKGEIFGLIGLNGAGKTTLIKIILGLLQQDDGSASIFGIDSHAPNARTNLSFLPEKFQPSHYLKGKEFLSLTLSYYGIKYDHEEARDRAEQLNLDPKVLDWKITKYSKGMGQKLGLLSALLTKTPLLMLDEPMSGLDPSSRIYLKDSLLDYAKSGDTIFFSSHILSDIDEICNRIAVLHANKMIFVGTPEEFKKLHNEKSLERTFLKAIAEIDKSEEKKVA